MFVFMVTGQREERARPARRRLIIVGRMAQPRRKRPRVCRGEAKLRKDDVLLVQAYELPLVPKSLIAATVVSGRQERQTFLDKTAGALAVPPTMRIDQLIEIDSVESLLPRLSERAELTVLGKIHQHSAGRGHSGIPPAAPLACLDIPSWQCLAAGRQEQMIVAPTALTRIGSIPRGISITSSA
jgi:hypothetical protein